MGVDRVVWVWTGLCGCGQGCVGVDRVVYVWTGLCGCGQGCVGVDRVVWVWTGLCGLLPIYLSKIMNIIKHRQLSGESKPALI